ncbi:hypothetical protein E4U32_008031 [Claviceps aff. humidiphila group G2b]|nr:hypothetical protein E4U32_008031 [Claviceps aff. humidiphila group G2b]
MVQVLVNPSLSAAAPPGPEQHQDDIYHASDASIPSREEHTQRMKDLSIKRTMMRAPRRGWSMSDDLSQRSSDHRHHHARFSSPTDRHQASIPENAILPSPFSRPDSPASSITSSTSSSHSSTLSSPGGPTIHLPLRSKVPPRRSYSVTDKEPEPHHAHASKTIHLLDLPPELHYQLFEYLDPLDGACFGLSHPHLYAIHRRKNGSVPLHSRYPGPNDLEWAWRGAGPLLRRGNHSPHDSSPASSAAAAAALVNGLGLSHAKDTPCSRALEKLRIQGQVYCRKCGISRCELHRHLRDWMGHGYEYCEIRKVYGQRAGEEAKPHCYMSSPRNRYRCGRHGGGMSASASVSLNSSASSSRSSSPGRKRE